MAFGVLLMCLISFMYAKRGFSLESAIKIGVIIEQPFWQGNTSVLEQIVANVMQNGPTNHQLILQSVTDGINAAEAACSSAENGSQVLMSFVCCKTAKFLDSLAAYNRIPQVFFLDRACKIDNTGNHYTVAFQPHYSLFGKAAVSVAEYLKKYEVGLFYDDTLDSLEVHEFLTALSEKLVTTRLFRLSGDKKDAITLEIEGHLASIKKMSIPIFVCITNEHTQLFFRAALESEMLDQEYFWIFLLHSSGDSYGGLANHSGSNVVFIGRNQTINDDLEFYGIHGALLRDAFETIIEAINHHSNFTVFSGNHCDNRPELAVQQSKLIANNIFTVNKMGHSGKISFDSTKYLTDIRYAIYSAGNTNGSNLIYVGEWNSTVGLTLFSDRLFYNTFRDFGNKMLTVGSIELEPFAMKRTNNNVTRWVGFCFDILDELAEQLNFRYTIAEPKDNMWGGENEDGTWNGVVSEVMRGEVALGISSFTITSAREKVIDFTKPFLEDGIGIIMRRTTEDPGQMFKMFQPFRYTVWASTSLAVLAVGVVLFLTNKFSPHVLLGDTDECSSADQKGISGSLWLVFGTYMEQGGGSIPSAISSRVVLVFWWVFTLLMVSTYTANLAAFLTVTISTKPINSLSDLATHSEIKPTSIYSSNIYDAFKSSDNAVYQMIWSSLSQSPVSSDTADHLRLVRTGQYAFLDDRLSLEYTALKYCEIYTLADEIFNTAGYGIILPEDAPFSDAFNHNIIKMQEAGLIAKWKKKWWPRSDKCSSKDTKSGAHILDIDSLGGLFLVYGSMTLVSIICLLVEIFFRTPWGKKFTQMVKSFISRKKTAVTSEVS